MSTTEAAASTGTNGNGTSGYRWVGTRPVRHDGLDKVAGKARYAADLNLPGMLYGHILRSPHPHARIVSIDTSAAEAMPGVKAVVTGADFPEAPPKGATRNLSVHGHRPRHGAVQRPRRGCGSGVHPARGQGSGGGHQGHLRAAAPRAEHLRRDGRRRAGAARQPVHARCRAAAPPSRRTSRPARCTSAAMSSRASPRPTS